MKVPGSVRDLYERRRPAADLLMDRVDRLMSSAKQPRWHYESRVKGIESFAQKLETGREVDDFFACTLVVQNSDHIDEAVSLCEQHFDLVTRRPPSGDTTRKEPHSFRFDDLRLYMRWLPGPARPEPALVDQVFEVQVKTFLQHAWGIATHDIMYKAIVPAWATERIGFQVKAMLEHAEVSIQQAAHLSESSVVRLTTVGHKRIAQILRIVGERWEASRLPSDRRRLAQNVLALLEACHLRDEQLVNALDAEAAVGRGAKILNLSPFGTIVQTLIFRHPKQVQKFVAGKDRNRFRLFIPPEVDLRSIAIPSGTVRVVRP